MRRYRGYKLINDYKVKGGTHVTIYEEMPEQKEEPIYPVIQVPPTDPKHLIIRPDLLETPQKFFSVSYLERVLFLISLAAGLGAILALLASYGYHLSIGTRNLVRSFIRSVIFDFIKDGNLHEAVVESIRNITKL